MQTLKTTTQKLETFKETGCRKWTGLALVLPELNLCLTLSADGLSFNRDWWQFFQKTDLHDRVCMPPQSHLPTADMVSNFHKAHLLFLGSLLWSWRPLKNYQKGGFFFFFWFFKCFSNALKKSNDISSISSTGRHLLKHHFWPRDEHNDSFKSCL